MLFLVIFVSFVTSLFGETYIDVCGSDPRVLHLKPSCKPVEYILHFPRHLVNPNHAIHDHLNAFTNYLVNCATDKHRVVLNYNPVNISQCSFIERSSKIPGEFAYNIDWGICVIYIITAFMNIPMSFHPTEPKSWPEEATKYKRTRGCAHQLFFSVRPKGFGNDGFAIDWDQSRGFSTLARRCTKGVQCNATALIPLPEKFKATSYRTIHESVRNFYRISPRYKRARPDRKVQILLYDRNDTHQRQWLNAGSVADKYKHDERVTLNFIRKTPKRLQDQVELYSSADIFIGPHGAAMANTIFMDPGTDILEISNRCANDALHSRFRPPPWTGWHAQYLGISAVYIQCHESGGNYKTPEELLPRDKGTYFRGSVNVRPEDVFELLEPAISRQALRLKKEVEKLKLRKSNSVNSPYIESFRYNYKVENFIILFSSASILLIAFLRRNLNL